jgi:hypothetical protein
VRKERWGPFPSVLVRLLAGFLLEPPDSKELLVKKVVLGQLVPRVLSESQGTLVLLEPWVPLVPLEQLVPLAESPIQVQWVMLEQPEPSEPRAKSEMRELWEPLVLLDWPGTWGLRVRWVMLDSKVLLGVLLLSPDCPELPSRRLVH